MHAREKWLQTWSSGGGISLSASCLLSSRIFVEVSSPPRSAGYHPPSAGNVWWPGAMLSPVFFPVPRCFGLPPLTCAADGTLFRCWWGGLGDGAPRDVLDCLDAATGVVWRVG